MTAVHRSTRWVLVSLVLWTVFVWGNRLSNAWTSDTETTGAKVFSTVLALSFLAFAVATAWIVRRTRDAELDRPMGRVLQAFAAWTTAVWVVRMVAIALADHSVGFKVVHAMLGVVSIALAVPAWRAGRAATAGPARRDELSSGMAAS